MEKVDKKIQLKDLGVKLLGIELDLDLVEQNLDAVECDINYLILIEEESIYNISILKSSGIVADLKTYRQSCIQLAHVQSRIQQFKNKRSDLINKLKQKLTNKEYHQKEWDRLHKEIESERVILIFQKRK